MTTDADERCCGNCKHFVQHLDHDFNGFCAFSWPPYLKAKSQPVDAYDCCDLFVQFNQNDITIEFLEEP